MKIWRKGTERLVGATYDSASINGSNKFVNSSNNYANLKNVAFHDHSTTVLHQYYNNYQGVQVPAGPVLSNQSHILDSSSTANATPPGYVPTRRVHFSPENEHPSTPQSSSHRRKSSINSGVSQSDDNVSRRSQYPPPGFAQVKKIEKCVPKNMDKHVQIYMSADLFSSNSVIPLWSPSPSIELVPEEWRHHVNVGDVGFFNDEGGFDTLFNIFLSREENISRHHSPPEDFVHFNLNPTEKSSWITKEAVDFYAPVKLIGAAGLDTIPHGVPVVGYPCRVNGPQCSMLYVHSGYRTTTIKYHRRPQIMAYIHEQQETWELHVGRQYSDYLQSDCPLLVIYSSYHTTSCALAAGAKPSLFASGWNPQITLQEVVEGDHVSHVWVTNDFHIQTKFSPSLLFREKLKKYVGGEGASLSDDERRMLEECHCIGIEAFRLKKRGLMRGGSFATGRDSRSTIMPLPRWNKFRASLPSFR